LVKKGPKSQNLFDFFSKLKKPKELKKGQKLGISPQKNKLATLELM